MAYNENHDSDGYQCAREQLCRSTFNVIAYGGYYFVISSGPFLGCCVAIFAGEEFDVPDCARRFAK